VSGQNSASRLDRVLGPRSPVLRRSIAGIPSHGRPITGTGVRRIGQRALISIAGISGLPRVAWRRRGWGSGVIADTMQPLGLAVRGGLHTGEIDLRGDDIGGIAVNIAARVAAMAGPRPPR